MIGVFFFIKELQDELLELKQNGGSERLAQLELICSKLRRENASFQIEIKKTRGKQDCSLSFNLSHAVYMYR